MTHANAPSTPEGRLRLARLIVEHGWSVRRAAERFQCSPATAAKWADSVSGGEPMTIGPRGRCARPTRSPQRLERRIVELRYPTLGPAPHQLSPRRSAVDDRPGTGPLRMPLLAHIDQATGLPVRKPKPVRYEAAAPGELVHVDIKKLGRIPDGGGWRALAAARPRTGARSRTRPGGHARARRLRVATCSCTTQSTTTPGWPTPSSSPTSARRPPPPSGHERRASSPTPASPSPPS